MMMRLPSRLRTVALVVLMVVVGLLLAWLAATVLANTSDLTQGEKRDVQLSHNVRQLRSALDTANTRLQRQGGRPVPVPDVAPPPPPGPQGETGPRGPAPTSTAIQAAIAVYCADTNACQGAGGRHVNSADVAAAVATYCNARGECVGRRGVAGEPGTAGAAGEPVTGPQGIPGPPPSAEAVAAAVAAFCDAHGQCQGPPGPQGPPGADSTVPGPQGPPGPTCPDGFDQERLTVVTPQGGTRDILTCTPIGG